VLGQAAADQDEILVPGWIAVHTILLAARGRLFLPKEVTP
jgi:hypothetical protein